MNLKDVPVYHNTIGDLKRGGAFTIPGVGIFIDKNYRKNEPAKDRRDLLRHEYGHILQERRYGWADYTVVAITSVVSAEYSNNHQQTWTEKEANTLTYLYFGRPKKWSDKYPIDTNYMNTILKTGEYQVKPKVIFDSIKMNNK